MMFGYYGSHMGVAGWTVMVFGGVVFWLIIAGVVVWSIRHLELTSPHPAPEREDPNETLAARFARGEIDEDEYASRSRALRAHGF